MRVRRIDSVVLFGAVTLAGVTTRLDAVEVTPEGFHVYDALYSRADIVQEYDDGRGGVIREYRPEIEVFDQESLDSFELRPLTDRHPSSNLDAKTARMHARGAITAGRKHADGLHVAGRVAVWDAELIGKFEARRRAGKPMQFSVGYELDLDPTPGVLPDGRRFDAIQRRIRANHLAAVEAGRAMTAEVVYDALDLAGAWDLGKAKRLADVAPHRGRVTVDMGRWCRHDSSDVLAEFQQPEHQDTTMKKIKIQIDGKDVELEVAKDASPEQIADAVSKAHADAAKVRADAHKLELDKARADAEKAKRDAMAFGKKPKGEGMEEEDGKAKLDAAVAAAEAKVRADERARMDAAAEAKAILGLRFDTSKLDANGLRLAVIDKVLGEKARKDAEADSGCVGYLYRQALAQHVDGPSHHDALLSEIQQAKAKAANTDGAEAKPGPIVQARKDAEAAAALPKHLRDEARKAG